MNQSMVLPKHRLEELIALLWRQGYRVLGPVVHEGNVLFDEVRSIADMPIGVRDAQEAGRYRLEKEDDDEIFGVVNGAGSLKPFFFAPEETLLKLERDKSGFKCEEVEPDAQKIAFLGVRACDLAALAIQDRIFLYDKFRDTHYAARRRDAFFVAVNCTRSASTCFCVSMKTGPAAIGGFDLSLTEQAEGFVVRSGSEAGAAILSALALGPASNDQLAAAEAQISACAAGMKRHLETADLPRLLYEQVESPRWRDVASRCLSCTNCTMVCPTCFCHSVIDQQEISGNMSLRVRHWDSCFSLEHAHIHGINFRPKIHDRYRQWLTHKLAAWIDQFGTSGCVGCGRCIAWCPVGIDLTEEIAAIRSMASGS
jgi:sulfhydrogenase subunit beta (sulfur reductase)